MKNGSSVTLDLQEEAVMDLLKKGVWVYFFLLIFEGALRKWFLPQLAEPLLIIRDPLAILMMYKAVQHNVWRPNIYIILMVGVTVLALILALIVGHGDLKVALYGLRILMIQFPVMFLMGEIFNREDVLKLGKLMLWITIGMTILVAIQFYSPQSAWVNRGVGGDISGSGFSGGAGFFRVPGTFSFTNGLSLFYGLAAAYIFYFWSGEEGNYVSRPLLLCASASLLAAVPLSISRTVVFEIVLSVIFMLAISAKNPKVIKNFIGVAIVGVVLFIIIGDFSFFQTATVAFEDRFTNANKNEGGMVEGVLIDRFLGGMVGAVTREGFHFWGQGLGMGTSVGAKLLVGDSGAYLIAEEEWPRLVGEMGLILGLLAIIIRLSMVIHLFKAAWAAVGRGNGLPWLLLSFAAINLLQGQWSQPTTLGFSVFAGSLIIASLHKENES